MPSHRSVNRPVVSTVPPPRTTVDVALLEDALLEDALVDEDLLVEEVSIDGMCGVY
jgi:mycofactocin precursor